MSFLLIYFAISSAYTSGYTRGDVFVIPGGNEIPGNKGKELGTLFMRCQEFVRNNYNRIYDHGDIKPEAWDIPWSEFEEFMVK
ncbi:MAG: hypothetical protein SVK08_00010 [Halobacteriota archaeon]|nr:hypothetical protein [Halobacteriota archaeon]